MSVLAQSLQEIFPPFIVLFLFLLKHFFADWFFQSSKMAANKGTDWRWLSLHCAYHVVLSIPIVFALTSLKSGLLLIMMEFGVHYAIDWLKSRPSVQKAYPWPSHAFWVLIGLDQFFHQIWYGVMTLLLFHWCFQ